MYLKRPSACETYSFGFPQTYIDNHSIPKGCVNEPYTRYPNFLETLLNFLRTEQRGTIRGQTLRLLGLLGALDPYRHKMAIGQIG